ncbi:MAG: SDR family oxidoreductase [Planctomycetes bacterium]|nr:SDR family oxidoreductase [Planctomycetota bacterium]
MGSDQTQSPDGVRQPKTALITGASSGIGAAFARALAARGYDLVLVARRENRLRELAEALQSSDGVEAEVLAADLADPEQVKRVQERITQRTDLELLINNAGFGREGKIAEVDLDGQVEMINVHVVATVRLTGAALRGMVQRGRGAVINVSSLAGFIAVPGASTYCSTKAYLNVFSEIVGAELRGTGVHVQALCPGYTYTGFHDTEEFRDFDRSQIPKALWMSAERVVAASLKALDRKRRLCIPGVNNRLLAILLRSRLFRPILRTLAGRASR